MSLIKCCVSDCNATSATHKLFIFPKNDYLRNLWMSFLVPNNSLLIGLSKEQLLRKRVCEKHFDKHQFDKDGKRLRFSFPCLFTNGEITSGEPLLSARIGQLSEHNYCKKQIDDEDEFDDSLLVIGKADDNFHEYPSCSYSQTISVTDNLHTGSGNTSSMETTAEVVEFFDQLFDSVNCNPGGSARGKLRKAVKKNSIHHQFWTDATKKIKDLKYEDSRSKIAIQAGKSRLVRVPSLEGWITTLESFLRITKLLFDKYNVLYFYPQLINQDPLEYFFGRLRALNYRNIKPDTNTFLYSYKSLLLSNFLSPHSKFANYEVDDGETLLDFNILFQDLSNENDNLNTIATHSTSQKHEREYLCSQSGSLSKDDVILEKIKVQCSAYTAGFICRKMTKKIQCRSCLKTYTSSSKDEKIYSYIKYREFKMLKNNNLAYPSENLLIMYRDASTYVHNYLNKNGYKENLAKNIEIIFNKCLRFSCLGCCPTHNLVLKKTFIKNIIRLHAHNWCNILNKILKGDIEKRHVSNVSIQQCAYKKYKTIRLRKKTINK